MTRSWAEVALKAPDPNDAMQTMCHTDTGDLSLESQLGLLEEMPLSCTWMLGYGLLYHDHALPTLRGGHCSQPCGRSYGEEERDS